MANFPKIRGKYSLKIIRFLVYKLIYPLIIIFILLFIYKPEDLIAILNAVF